MNLLNDERALDRLADYQTRLSSEIIETNIVGNRLDIGSDWLKLKSRPFETVAAIGIDKGRCYYSGHRSFSRLRVWNMRYSNDHSRPVPSVSPTYAIRSNRLQRDADANSSIVEVISFTRCLLESCEKIPWFPRYFCSKFQVKRIFSIFLGAASSK